MSTDEMSRAPSDTGGNLVKYVVRPNELYNRARTLSLAYRQHRYRHSQTVVTANSNRLSL